MTRVPQLHIAAANGYLSVVEYLLDNHVCVDARDRDDWQPIHAAACWSHVSTSDASFETRRPAHRGRAGGPVRPIIPGVFLRRYLGRLLTYFNELNAVLQGIGHSFLYARKTTTTKQ